MTAADYFSNDFEQASQRFRQAATRAGCTLRDWPLETATGPGGQALSMTTAFKGEDNARAVLINLSGTHGVEGLAGSAAQTGWLETRGLSPLPRDCAVLFVHGVNPFGFAWDLRNNEDNVDLNRNWPDFTRALPDNPVYEELHRVLCITSLDDEAFEAAGRNMGDLARSHGAWHVEDALSRGQYGHPAGLYFGGSEPAWSRRQLALIAERHLDHAETVAIIDWHTGPVGDGELIYLCYAEPGSDAHLMAQDWWGADNIDAARVTRLWGGPRPTRSGLMCQGLAAELGGRRVSGGVIEFCSARPATGPAGALRGLMLERWLRHEGGLECPQAAAIRAELRDTYAPERASFRKTMLANALDVFDATLAGLARG
jgi:hypothetical protein